MKKKILLIHSGGTIGMTRDSRSGVLRPDRFYASLLKVIPEISSIADMEVEIPFVFVGRRHDLRGRGHQADVPARPIRTAGTDPQPFPEIAGR